MIALSRFSVWLSLLVVGFVLAGCGKDPLTERKFRLLVEENERLTSAGILAGVVPSSGEMTKKAPFTPDQVSKLGYENERLRGLITKHEKEKAFEANKVKREEIEKQVTAIRGLEFKEPVNYQILNRKEIKQTIEGKLAEVFSVEEFRHMADAMAAIGLLPEKYPLREKYIDLLGEQVAAFYDQHAHKLFMYEDATLENAQNRVVLAHELTHSLQDQHFSLKRMPLEIKTNDDRAAAASALVEGDATLVMSEFMMKNMSKQMFKDSMLASFTQNMKQLETAPRFLREMLVFPYLRGQEFCASLLGHDGYESISRAYANPPSSTAQILHPEKYLANPREEPIEIMWAETTVKGEKPVIDNVVGEMGLRILFAEWVDAMTGEKAGAGWRGDRYLYFASSDALLWKSVWANAAEAAEFFAAEKKLLEKRHKLTGARVGEKSYEADGLRVVRLKQTEANEVILIDAKTVDWAEALGAVR